MGNQASIGSNEYGVFNIHNGKKSPVVSKHPVVGLTVSEKVAKKSRIILSRSNIVEETFYIGKAVYKEESGIRDFLRLIDVNNGSNIPFETGIYRLEVKVGTRNDSYDYYLLPDVHPSFDKRIYYDETSGMLDLGSTYGKIDFRIPPDTVEWNMNVRGEIHQFISDVPLLRYDLGWGSMNDSFLRMSDLSDTISVTCPVFKNPVLNIYFDNSKETRQSERVTTFVYDISGIEQKIRKKKPSSCRITVSDGGNEVKLFDIDVPTKVDINYDLVKNLVEITVINIEFGSKVVLIEKNSGEKTDLKDGDRKIIDVSRPSHIVITEYKDGEETTYFEKRFNQVKINSDLELGNNCNRIANFIPIYVDDDWIVLEGNQFSCMLNNNHRFDVDLIWKLSELRWEIISRQKPDKKSSKIRFDRAVEYVMDAIVQEESGRANPDTRRIFRDKYAGTKYEKLFKD